MEIISSKQEEGFKATTFVVKVLIQEFVWSSEF